MGIWNSLQENLGITLGVSLGALLIVILLITFICISIYCCCRRRRSNKYSRLRTDSPQPLITSNSFSSANRRQANRGPANDNGGAAEEGREGREEGLYEAMQRQRQEQESTRRETGILNCQYYLRSNQKYVMETHLPDIGSRISKNWFMVNPIGATQYTNSYLLTMHPCVHKITSIDYIPDKRLVVIIEPFVQRGSLKDLIYQTTPPLSWSTKYSVRRSGLRLHQIQNYGRQILEAVLFLHDLGLEPLGQIQTGNVYIESGRCKLSGLDNSLLGYKPRIYRIIRHYRENLDSVMFGHLLFELASGRELSSPAPNEADYITIKLPQVVEVLQFIFQQLTPPPISEILQKSFFQSSRLSSLEHWSHEGVRLDEDMNSLIYKSRKGRTRPQFVKKKKDQSSGVSSYTEGIHPSSPSNTTSLMSTSAPRPKTTTTGPITSTPVPKPSTGSAVPPPPTSGDRSTSSDRSALLGDIHKGKKLRRTITNDRSAPILK